MLRARSPRRDARADTRRDRRVVSGARGRRTDPYNAGITWLDEPLTGADQRTPRRTHASREGPGRHRGRPHDVRLEDLRGPRARPTRDRRRASAGAGAALIGKANLAEFAWGVLGANEWYGTVHNPARSRPDDRRLVERERRGARRRPLRPRNRNRHRRLRAAPGRRVRDRRAEAAPRSRSRVTAVFHSAPPSTPSGPWRARWRTSRHSGRCLPRGPSRNPSSPGAPSGSCAGRRTRRRARHGEERRGRAWCDATRVARRPRGRGRDPGAGRRHVAGLPP